MISLHAEVKSFVALFYEKENKYLHNISINCQVFRCFDETNKRQNRLTLKDKFAPVCNLWDKWAELLPLFATHPYASQLTSNYWVSMVAAHLGSICTCAETSYIWNNQPYLGKQMGAATERNQCERLVLDLVEGLKGHNITMDNFFTSYELGQKLLQKNLTMVGTVRKKKFTTKFSVEKRQPLFQSTYAFTYTTTLVSYISKNKMLGRSKHNA